MSEPEPRPARLQNPRRSKLWLSRKIELLTRLDREMKALQHRWAVLQKHKVRVLNIMK